jgi:hypothetical protein
MRVERSGTGHGAREKGLKTGPFSEVFDTQGGGGIAAD